MNNQKPKKLGHEEVAKTPFDVQYAIDHIKLPDNPKDIPNIICWIGPARSGTTGLLFLLAGHPGVDRAYFQPIKTILRRGGPDFTLQPEHKTICMKEVFRGCCPENNHDPISALIKAGIPRNKITLISFMREPVSCYASWAKSFKGSTTDAFIATYLYNFKLFRHYKNQNIKIIPFVYDLLATNKHAIVDSLLGKVGLAPLNNLAFKDKEIVAKMDYGQAKDKKYFNDLLKKTLARGEFMYTSNNHLLSQAEIDKIKNACQSVYSSFLKEVKNEFAT